LPSRRYILIDSKLWQSKTTGYERSRPVSDGKTVIEKYTGVLAAADVFTESVAFQVMKYE
jgi:hypothetical protein